MSVAACLPIHTLIRQPALVSPLLAAFTLVNIPPTFAVLALAAMGTAALLWRRPGLRGTTLLPAWWWAVLSLLLVAGAELLVNNSTPGAAWADPLRFTAALSTFCPGMAVLGAKRPQDRAWHMIVLSLWIVLSLPAGHTLLFGSGHMELHTAWSVFLVLLIIAATFNYLPTRYWLSSVSLATAQLILLAPHSAWNVKWFTSVCCPVSGLAFGVLAIVLTAFGLMPSRGAHQGLDRVWIDFRNLFGAVWSLRVAERINASAKLYDWKFQLNWHGFVRADGGSMEDLPAEIAPNVLQNINSLLRRFVSPEWIAKRLGKGVE